MSDTESTIKYMVTDSKGDFMIEIPKTWKITFASVNPASNMAARDGYCLRVYEGKDKLRAVFGNVKAVRDMGIPLARKVERQTGSSTWSKDSIGNFKEEAERTVESEFVLESGGGDES